MPLNWTTSVSADNQNHDQETDLAAIGNPGGAEWASVAPQGNGRWSWAIYTRWLWEDIDADPASTLASDETDGEGTAKAAVEALVAEAVSQRLEAIRASLRAQNISYGELAELQSLAPFIDPGDIELLEPAGVPESGS